MSFGMLTGCSSSSKPAATVAITASGGTPQSATIGAAFATALQVTVTSNGSPASGVAVTFSAPSSGASCALSPTTATTNSSGQATATCTANTTAGTYNVTATASGATSSASFALTNLAGPAAGLSATSGNNQSVAPGATFASLVASVVDASNNPVAQSGVAVTFTVTAGTSSGTFTSTSSNTEIVNTDANGNATVTDLVASSTTGSFTVAASATGLTSANFSETISTSTATTATYVFYANGVENINGGPNYYAVAGQFTLDETANPPTVIGGELDYNNGFTVTATAVPITGGASSITNTSTTGQGTITLTTGNASLGASGTITLAAQFANPGHAAISQFDGSATSSGGMDLQTATNANGANSLAFTLSGVDENYFSVAYGGVFAVTGGGGGTATFSGTADANSSDTVIASAGPSGDLTGGSVATDSFGRGTATFTITGNAALVTNPTTLSLAYYVVGPSVVRIIDVDAGGTAGLGSAMLGSAYGQGTNGTAGSNSSLATSVFGMNSGSWAGFYAEAGQIVPNSGTGTFTGEGDDDEAGNILAAATAISGSYTIGSNGYGSMTGITGLGNVTTLGLYATDPTLNLYDPNNPTNDLGGALILEMDPTFTIGGTASTAAGGTGFLVPQSPTIAATDLNNSYAFGAQDFNALATVSPFGWEFDTVGQAPMASLALTGATGEISDPSGDFVGGSAGEYTAIPFAGTAAGPDAAGNYFYGSLGLAVGPVGTNTTATGFTVSMYEASGNFLFWMDEDTASMWLGTLEAQSTTVKSSAKGKPATKAAGNHKR